MNHDYLGHLVCWEEKSERVDYDYIRKEQVNYTKYNKKG